MNTRIAWGLAACLLGLAGAGRTAVAAGPPPHVMGQDYSTYGKSLSGPVERQGGHYGMSRTPSYFNPHHERTATWHGHYATPGVNPYGEHHGHPGWGHHGFGHCPPGMGHCPPGYCPHGLPGAHCRVCSALTAEWRPTHHHFFSYSEPTGLVYPPANQPPAVVQYPYYTTKGPDDFFLDRDGARGVSY